MNILATLVFIALLPSAWSFDRPESVYVHGNHLYVTNMSGPGNAKDGIGWISKLDKKGKVLKEKWIDGLNAPKGLGLFKDRLYTADIDEVVVIDIAKAKFSKVPVPGAKLLNDIAVDPNGNLYISDTFGSKLFRMDAKTQAVEELAILKDAPNGLLLIDDVLYIAGYGKAKADATGMEDGPKGGLWSLDLKTKELRSVLPEIGKIDGIQLLKDKSVVISVKVDEAIYWVDLKEAKITGALKGLSSMANFTDVADMGFDQNTNILYVPNTKTHDIQQIRLK